jgi:hypothetical protein
MPGALPADLPTTATEGQEPKLHPRWTGWTLPPRPRMRSEIDLLATRFPAPVCSSEKR